VITKSDYLKYLQCPKYFWLYKNRKSLIPGVSETDQAKFDQGYEVEKYAQKLFKNGAEIKGNFRDGKKETEKFAKKRKNIFQATAMPKDLLARADILNFNENTGKWDIYEVKSTTEVKDEHIPDLCFQKIAFERDGYKIGETFLIHVNSDYVKTGKIAPKKFLTTENITEQVENFRSIVETDIPKALALLNFKDEMKKQIGQQCKLPYTCAFKEYCWGNLPKYSIYDIKRFNGDKLLALRDAGILEITDIPDDFPLSATQQNQVLVAKTKKPIIDIKMIESTINGLEFPLYFLDYETYASAVPLFDGTHPYQNICFQYSLHVIRSQGTETEHYEFLHTDKSNPMPKLLSSLVQHIGETGSVIVWNKAFETTRNEEMAKQYPEYAKFLHSINDRIFDLMEIFSKQYYVHPDFKGSCSIKKVLPVLVSQLSHSNLEGIQEGGIASLYWFKHIFNNSQKKDNTIKNLLEYCKLDTFAMVAIYQELKKI